MTKKRRKAIPSANKLAGPATARITRALNLAVRERRAYPSARRVAARRLAVWKNRLDSRGQGQNIQRPPVMQPGLDVRGRKERCSYLSRL